MTLVPGTTLGPYRIIEQVGKGGMATVYKGYQAALTRYVAVKVLPPHLAEDLGFRERFRAEAVTVSKLRHPNILQIHDFGEDQGLSYLVLEFVDGGTLADQLGKPLPVDYVVRMLLPVASALDYAHSRDVVHRDLKPSNVLLARDGTPVLSDFGLARMMMGSLPRLTQTGAMVGTPEYMAPEQAGGEEAGPAADRYALAVIAYEMLTGSVPFHAETPLATLFAHAYRPLPLPRSRNPQLSEAIEAVLLKGLAKGPEERFATCAELVRSLEEAGRAPAVVLQAAQVPAPPAPAPAPAPPAPQAAAPEPAALTPAPPPAPAPASAPEAAAQAPLAPPPPTVAAPTPRVAAVPRLPLPGRTLALLGGAVALVVVGAVVGVIVAGGQRQVPGAAQTAIPSPTPTSAILVPPSPRPTPTATPAATPTAAPASPTAVLTGTATVTGSVKWSTSGIAGVDVHLVRDTQTLATVATDASGQFRFTRVPAGEYFVRPQLTSDYASSGTPARRAVAEGSTVEIGTIRLYKALTISDPPEGAEVPSSVTLKWQRFEGAARYRVEVRDRDSRVQVLLRETTDTASALSGANLQAGRRYTASVTALQDSIGIALGSRNFSVR